MSRHSRLLGMSISCLLCAALAGSLVVLGGCSNAPAGIGSTATATAKRATAGAARVTAAPPRATAVDTLVHSAVAAYQAGHVVAPARSNAFEYYLEILRRQPGNRVARDALRESFPFAVDDVERTIAGNDFDEANREIDLLAAADPGNYSVTTLRTRLAARVTAFRRQHPGLAPSAMTTPAQPITTAHSVTLRASADSWVEIAGANGRAIDSRVLRAGESRTYQVSGPVRVTLGNAAAVQVTRDGQLLPVASNRRDKVAHLDLFAGI